MAAPRTNYVAFLRAINVAGRVVKMDRLRELFSELGFANVRTYIQSGNVFFDAAGTDRAALTRKIDQHLLATFGYEVPAFLRTVPEVERAVRLDPFKDVMVTSDVRLFVVFMSQPLPSNVALPLRSPIGDFELLGATPGEAFVVMRRVAGRPGNPSGFIEKTFKVKATARFFGTTAKILEAAKST